MFVGTIYVMTLVGGVRCVRRHNIVLNDDGHVVLVLMIKSETFNF